MKKYLYQLQIVSVILLLSLPGCSGSRKRQSYTVAPTCTSGVCDTTASNQSCQESNMALANEQCAYNQDAQSAELESFFDENTGEFIAQADLSQQELSEEQEYAYNDSVSKLQNIYFDFNKRSLKEDQKAALAEDIAQAKAMVTAMQEEGLQPKLIVEGHACHSSGASAYNLALSENRAKVVADQLAANGIPAECIKVVGRGAEVPAILDGKKVTGDKQQQWANRRVEIHVGCDESLS